MILKTTIRTERAGRQDGGATRSPLWFASVSSSLFSSSKSVSIECEIESSWLFLLPLRLELPTNIFSRLLAWGLLRSGQRFRKLDPAMSYRIVNRGHVVCDFGNHMHHCKLSFYRFLSDMQWLFSFLFQFAKYRELQAHNGGRHGYEEI